MSAPQARRRGGWVLPYVRQYWRALLLALLLGVATFAFATGLMVTAGYLVAGSARVESVLLLEIPLILVRVFGLGKPLLSYAERLASHNWVLRMTSSLRLKLYNTLERRALRPGAKRRSGDVLGLLSDDIGHLQDLYLRVAFPLVVAWVLYVALLGIMGALSTWAMLALLLLLGVELFVMPLVSVLTQRARQLQAKQLHHELYETLTDDVLGIHDWVCSGREGEYRARHASLQRRVHRLQRASDAFARVRDMLAQLLFGLCVVVLLVWAADAFGSGAGDPNWIAAFALGFFPLVEAFAPVPQAATDALAHTSSLQRLRALSAEDGERDADGAEGAEESAGGAGGAQSAGRDARSARDGHAAGGPQAAGGNVPAGNDAPVAEAAIGSRPASDDMLPAGGPQIAGDGHAADGPQAAGGKRVAGCGRPADRPQAATVPHTAAPREPQPPYDIELADVRFAHEPDGRAIIDGLTLSIPAGTKLAVLGRSGAGKSTLVSLMRGDLSPQGGRVTLGGVPCAELREHMPRYIGVIDQDCYLFNMSLYDNVRIGRPQASEQDVLDALEAVGLGALVRSLPDGLATLMGEAGKRFSGGERHRIAIARLLLADVPIVVLDEPMVSLDPVCERELLQTLLSTFEGKTIIMVTHHLQGVARMDDVVFLENGRLKLHGSPAELESTSEHYRTLQRFDTGAR